MTKSAAITVDTGMIRDLNNLCKGISATCAAANKLTPKGGVNNAVVALRNKSGKSTPRSRVAKCLIGVRAPGQASSLG
jgi:hypothetical protein